MTWDAKIVKPDGSGRVDGVYGNVCDECLHGGPVPGGHSFNCKIQSAAHTLGYLLTAIDVCADGHMASGTAKLHCNGFEAKPTEIRAE